MLLVAMLRHGDTAWSAEGRIQGHTDVPLSDAGRARMREFRLPAACGGMRVVTSPLARCIETAALIGAPHAEREPRLIEMNWGAWQGRRLPGLRAGRRGAHAGERARRGAVLPPLSSWLAAVTTSTLAITHRGVIRAAFAAAAGWDLRGNPPAKLDWSAVQLFRFAPDGSLAIEALTLR